MPAYKIILPDRRGELPFSDEKSSLVEASQKARELNKILTVKQQEQDGQWVECATVFPNGEVRRPVNIGAFAENLPMRRGSNNRATK